MMSIKQSPEIVKEIIELPLSYIKYIFRLLRRKYDDNDQANMKLHIAYLILSLPMSILLIQLLYYFSNGALNIKLLSAINIYSYAMFLILNIVWLSLNFTFLMSILLIFQKKMTMQNLKIVFLEPIKFYTVGSVFISLALYVILNEKIVNKRDLLDIETFKIFMNESTLNTILVLSMELMLLAVLIQTIVKSVFIYFRFWHGVILSSILSLALCYATVQFSALTFNVVPEFLKASPNSLIIKDEFCQQVVDAEIDRNQTYLENMDFKAYKMRINQCKKEKILGVD